MTDKPRYWSQPFIDVFVEALNNDPTFQKIVRSFTNSINLRCLDAPDGKDISAIYHIDRGKVSVDARFEDAPSASFRKERFDKKTAMARVTVPYDLWTKLDRKEINVVRALAAPEYKVDGKLNVLRHIKVFNAMSEVASGVDKSY